MYVGSSPTWGATLKDNTYMITLKDGTKWILDDAEWEDAGISYEDAIKGKIPETTYEDFIDAIVAASKENEFCLPRKLTTEDDGYWDCNFSVTEVFDSVCVKSFETPWNVVYFMPWGKIYVEYIALSCCGEATCSYAVYNSEDEFTQASLGNSVVS